jgi:REP element-mobilizing transposase RayT
MPGTHTKLLYHIVFSTKLRVPSIKPAIAEELHRYIAGIVRGEGGAPIAIGGMPDHVHLLIQLTPIVALADIMRQLKANSSKWMNERHPRTRKFGWQDGYAAFTVSESRISRVSKYIREQESHHRQIPFREELRALLLRHGVEFEEQYL